MPAATQPDVVLEALKELRALIKPTNSHIDDKLRKEAQEDIANLVIYLCKNPDRAHNALSLAQSDTKVSPISKKKSFGESRAPASNNEPRPDSYTTFRLVPKYWLWSLVQKVQPKFTASVVECVEGCDSDSVRKLVVYAFGRKAVSKLPPACLDKAVHCDSMVELYTRMGSRLNDSWFKGAISAIGCIDWQSYGVYTMKIGDDGSAYLMHKPSGQRVHMKGMTFDANQEFKENWADNGAAIPLSFTSIDCFGAVSELKDPAIGGLAEMLTNEYYKAVAEEIKQKRTAQRAELDEGGVKVDADLAGMLEPKKKRSRKAPPAASTVPKKV